MTAPAAAEAAEDSDRPVLVTSAPFNKRGEPVGGLSPDAQHQMMTFLFGAKDGDWDKDLLRADDGFVLVSLKEHKTSTAADFEKEKSTFEGRLLGAKQAEALATHVTRLREQAKDQIKIDESFIADLRGDGGANESGEEEDEEAP